MLAISTSLETIYMWVCVCVQNSAIAVWKDIYLMIVKQKTTKRVAIFFVVFVETGWQQFSKLILIGLGSGCVTKSIWAKLTLYAKIIIDDINCRENI